MSVQSGDPSIRDDEPPVFHEEPSIKSKTSEEQEALDLEHKIKETEQQIFSKQEEMGTLSASLKEHHATLGQAKDELHLEVDVLGTQLKSARSDLNRLKQTKKGVVEDLRRNKSQMGEEKLVIDGRVKVLSQTFKKLSVVEEKAKDASRELSSLDTEKKALSADISALEQELATLKMQSSSNEKAIEATNAKHSNQADMQKEAIRTSSEQKTQMAQAKVLLKELKYRESDLAGQKRGVEAEEKVFESQIKKNEADILRISISRKFSSTPFIRSIQEYFSDVPDLKKANIELGKQLSGKKIDASLLSSQISLNAKEITRVSSNIEEINEQIAEFENTTQVGPQTEHLSTDLVATKTQLATDIASMETRLQTLKEKQVINSARKQEVLTDFKEQIADDVKESNYLSVPPQLDVDYGTTILNAVKGYKARIEAETESINKMFNEKVKNYNKLVDLGLSLDENIANQRQQMAALSEKITSHTTLMELKTLVAEEQSEQAQSRIAELKTDIEQLKMTLHISEVGLDTIRTISEAAAPTLARLDQTSLVKPPSVGPSQPQISKAMSALNEIPESEASFFKGAQALLNSFRAQIDKLPNHKFSDPILQSYYEKLEDGVNKIRAFNDELQECLKESDVQKKMELLNKCYASSAFESYAKSLNELAALDREIKQPRLGSIVKGIFENASYPGANDQTVKGDSIIFVQRATRHAILIKGIDDQVNDVIKEIPSSEEKFLKGANTLLENMKAQADKFPDHKFPDPILQSYYEKLEDGVNKIRGFNDELQKSLNKELTLQQRVKLLEDSYSSPLFVNYKNSVEELARMDSQINQNQTMKDILAGVKDLRFRTTKSFVERLSTHERMIKESRAYSQVEMNPGPARGMAQLANEEVRKNEDIKFLSTFKSSMLSRSVSGKLKTDEFRTDMRDWIKTSYNANFQRSVVGRIQNMAALLPNDSEKEISSIRKQLLHYAVKYSSEFFQENLVESKLLNSIASDFPAEVIRKKEEATMRLENFIKAGKDLLAFKEIQPKDQLELKKTMAYAESMIKVLNNPKPLNK